MRRLLIAATGAIALVAAGLGVATAQAAVPTASAAGAAGSAVTTRAVCGSPGQGPRTAVSRSGARTARPRAANQRMNSALSAGPGSRSPARPRAHPVRPRARRHPVRLQVDGLGAAAAPSPSSTPTTTRPPRPTSASTAASTACPRAPRPTAASARSTRRRHRATPPQTPAGREEISLDLDMVCATCPDCKILLVEANSAAHRRPRRRREHAAAQLGAKAISNSYGGSDLPDSTVRRALQPPRHRRDGAAPATTATAAVPRPSSQYVTAVGGTSLRDRVQHPRLDRDRLDAAPAAAARATTPALPGSVGVNTGCAGAPMADVSAVADPNTGVAVYDTRHGRHRLARVRRHQRLVADHRVGLRAGRQHRGLANAFPYSHTELAVRRDERQQRALQRQAAVHRRRRLGRPDRPRHAERRRRVLTAR